MPTEPRTVKHKTTPSTTPAPGPSEPAAAPQPVSHGELLRQLVNRKPAQQAAGGPTKRNANKPPKRA